MTPPREEVVLTRYELEKAVEENRQLKRHVHDNTVWFGLMRELFTKLGMPREANGCRLLGQRGQELLSVLREREVTG